MFAQENVYEGIGCHSGKKGGGSWALLGEYHQSHTSISAFEAYVDLSSSKVLFQERKFLRVGSLSIYWPSYWI